MDRRPDLLDLADQEKAEEENEASYEPGWYSILKEAAQASERETAPQTS